MALESGVVAKIAAAVGLAGISSAGVYYGQDYFSPKSSLSKYDQILIDFLEGTNNDIIFEVKNGDADLTAENLILNNSSSTITAKVQISTTNKTKFKFNGSDISDGELTKLKKHNANADWTWSCTVQFQKETSATSNDIKDEHKNRIMGEDGKGLFSALTKSINAYNDPAQENASNKWTKNSLKQAKKNFIKQCAEARETEKSKKLTEAVNNDITTNLAVTKTFGFTDNSETPKKLVAKPSDDFNAWFPAEYGTKDFQTGN